MNKGPSRYTERSFPSYRYIPGLHPHPVNSSEGHSYGDEEVEYSSWDSDKWRENEDYLYGVDYSIITSTGKLTKLGKVCGFPQSEIVANIAFFKV